MLSMADSRIIINEPPPRPPCKVRVSHGGVFGGWYVRCECGWGPNGRFALGPDYSNREKALDEAREHLRRMDAKRAAGDVATARAVAVSDVVPVASADRGRNNERVRKVARDDSGKFVDGEDGSDAG